MPVELRQLYPQRVYEFGDSESTLAVNHTVAGPALEVQTKRDAASNQVAVFRGGDRSSEVFHPLTQELAMLHQNLKKAFDPAGILNSGRLYEGI